MQTYCNKILKWTCNVKTIIIVRRIMIIIKIIIIIIIMIIITIIIIINNNAHICTDFWCKRGSLLHMPQGKRS